MSRPFALALALALALAMPAAALCIEGACAHVQDTDGDGDPDFAIASASHPAGSAGAWWEQEVAHFRADAGTEERLDPYHFVEADGSASPDGTRAAAGAYQGDEETGEVEPLLEVALP